jgi:hypothetical protein
MAHEGALTDRGGIIDPGQWAPGCTGKVRHETYRAARLALRRPKYKCCMTYRCSSCGFWHTGRRPKSEVLRRVIDRRWQVQPTPKDPRADDDRAFPSAAFDDHPGHSA